MNHHSSLRSFSSCRGALVVALAAAGCSSSSTATSTPDAGTDTAVTAAAIDYSGTISCTDNVSPPVTTSAPLVLKEVESCEFHGPAGTAPANRLDLAFVYGGSTGVARDNLAATINGFTGKGTFTTGPDETASSTFVHAAGYKETLEPDGTHSTPGGTSAGDASCRGACTITISEDSVTTAPLGGTGRIKGSITCTSLAAAGIGCVKCTVTASKIDFDIAGCNHAD
ncbi:MAG: hypothetical protein ACXWUG_22885 [Polyangiales bacterium]